MIDINYLIKFAKVERKKAKEKSDYNLSAA